MSTKLTFIAIFIQFVFIFQLNNKINQLEIKQKELNKDESSLIITSINEVNDRLKFVEDGVPEITKRNQKAKIVKDIVKENIRILKVNNFKSDHELNEYTFAVVDASDRFKVPISLILAVSRAESNFNARAISKTHAKGIMQIVDTTFDFCTLSLNKTNSDAFYVRDSVQCGTWYLKYLSKMFNGDTDLTIKAYNAGPNFILKFNGENLPTETKEYHENVITFMTNFKQKIYWEK